MDYKLINKISKIIPSQELKEHLLFGEYEDALEIVMDLAEKTTDDNMDIDIIFKIFYESIEDSDIKNLEIITEYIINHLALENIGNLILSYINEDFSDTKEYFKEISFINYYLDFENKDISKFYKELIAIRNKKYKEVEKYEMAFSFPINIPEGKSDPRLAYVEALMESNSFWYEKLLKAIVEDNPDLIMEQIQVNVCLNDLYYKFKQPEIDYIQTILNYAKAKKLKKE